MSFERVTMKFTNTSNVFYGKLRKHLFGEFHPRVGWIPICCMAGIPAWE